MAVKPATRGRARWNVGCTYPLSTISHTPYAIRHMPYAICHQPYAISHKPSAMISGLRIQSIVLLCAFAAAESAIGAQVPVEPWRLIQPPQASLVLARDGSLV